jgi:hypothetical protein
MSRRDPSLETWLRAPTSTPLLILHVEISLTGLGWIKVGSSRLNLFFCYAHTYLVGFEPLPSPTWNFWSSYFQDFRIHVNCSIKSSKSIVYVSITNPLILSFVINSRFFFPCNCQPVTMCNGNNCVSFMGLDFVMASITLRDSSATTST